MYQRDYDRRGEDGVSPAMQCCRCGHIETSGNAVRCGSCGGGDFRVYEPPPKADGTVDPSKPIPKCLACGTAPAERSGFYCPTCRSRLNARRR